jgi:hypothetical protein
LLIKIKPVIQNFSKEDVKILKNNEEIKFHLEISPFDKSRKIVFNLPFLYKQNVSMIIGKSQENINIFVLQNRIDIKSECISFGYVEIRINNIDFVRFLDSYSGQKGSHTIRLDRSIFSKKEEFVMAAFSALIDCEGSIDNYGFSRRIRIRMCNLDYLKDWKLILKKFNVSSNITRDKNLWSLYLCGWQNFKELDNLGIRLYHSEKMEKFAKLLGSYKRKQIRRSTWKEFYLNGLKSAGRPVSNAELSTLLGKSKRVVNHFLVKLEMEGLIKVDKSSVKHLYSTYPYSP